MLFRNSLIFLTVGCAEAFAPSPSVSSQQISTQQMTQSVLRPSTMLYAEEAEEAAEEAPAAASGAADDILNSPAFLKRKIDVLKSDIAAIDEKISAANEVYEANKVEWGPQIEKLRQEYANISDRLDSQNKAGSTQATKEVASKLLAVLDNYDRAFQQVTPETDDEKAIEASYKNVYAMIISTLGELGVKEVETVGIEFDYEFHQAVMMRPDEDYEEGIVCEELAKGWATNDGDLIRAAMVVVAA